MASEIIKQIDDTERLCDERIAAAQSRAADIITQAKERAAAQRAETVARAHKEADAMIAAAEAAARKTLEEAAVHAQADIAAMRKAAEGNTAKAVNAVAKRIVEWN